MKISCLKMLPTKIVFVIFALALLLFVRPSKQNLNKQPLLPGLGDELNFSFLKPPAYTWTSGGDASLCHCNGAAAKRVYTVSYHGVGNQQLVLCMCPNPVMSARYMMEMMGRVPYAIRRYNKAMISATAGTCGGAGSSGDVSFYCARDMHISVFIHESAHSADRGMSATSNWRDAVQNDGCVPDPYANSNYAETFAQVTVLWTHLVGQGQHNNLGGAQYACMKNQLQRISRVLEAWRIQAPRGSLQAGGQLQQDEALTSPNGAYRLVMQVDGNLVLYVSDNTVPANALWSTGTFGNGPHRFQVQTDGNLVTYDGNSRPTWASNSLRQNAERHHLSLQDDGNLVFYDDMNQPVWASNTCCFIKSRQ